MATKKKAVAKKSPVKKAVPAKKTGKKQSLLIFRKGGKDMFSRQKRAFKAMSALKEAPKAVVVEAPKAVVEEAPKEAPKKK